MKVLEWVCRRRRRLCAVGVDVIKSNGNRYDYGHNEFFFKFNIGMLYLSKNQPPRQPAHMPPSKPFNS